MLVTLGTVAGDRDALDAFLASLAPSDVNAVVTAGALGDPEALGVDRARVRPVGFVPLGRLLEGVDLVVAAGGAVTVLGALSRGLPMVLVPMVIPRADNPAVVGVGLTPPQTLPSAPFSADAPGPMLPADNGAKGKGK